MPKQPPPQPTRQITRLVLLNQSGQLFRPLKINLDFPFFAPYLFRNLLGSVLIEGYRRKTGDITSRLVGDKKITRLLPVSFEGI